ncbi:PREDICTED: uncharacterized protein LOC100639897 isoform X1 [Amphimedon queenslandica]|uniref:EGF-like domain-containing protein n=1 Tax=Amphimedon queenslandica TaxID=400682 RepID=A0AAN0IWN5_AMPQE|nr:PREDICTED: uncharacterized protein LOC100639897 isoform X1 [Amphimedon queenslandica]|eukprot:XP_019848846.1 PREDICTED: uncharacterized protein LOC100639897 isoform X1 [Amphimedon queenslandica]
MSQFYLIFRLILGLLLCSLGSSNTVLVTGGAGFIGYHVSRRLAGLRYEVVVLDSFLSRGVSDDSIRLMRADQLKRIGIIVLKGSVSDPHVIEYVFKHYPNINEVVHCAGHSSINDNNRDPLMGAESSLKSMVSLLDALVKHKDVRLVYMSTSGVYGIHSESPLSTTRSFIRPRDMLATFMLSVEEIVSGYVQEYHLKSAVGLRLFTVYGPWSNTDNIIHSMTQSIANGKTRDISLNLYLKRDLTYIEDVVDGILLALKYTPPFGHEVFNIGTGVGTKLAMAANLIKSDLRANFHNTLEVIKRSPSDVPEEEYADISATSESIGFSPKTKLRNGIRKFVLWWKEYNSYNYHVERNPADESITSKALDESIARRGHEFRERLADLREKYTFYAESHNIPVAKFYRHKTFKFYPDVEAPGTLRTERNTSFEHMKEVCDYMDDCVGFNTKGEIKTILQTSKPWAKGSGLHIANIDVCKAGLHNCFAPRKCVYKGPAVFSCVCGDGYQSIDQNCIEKYSEHRTSNTISDLRLRDILSGLNPHQFMLSDSSTFYCHKGRDSPNGDLLYVPNANKDPSILTKACRMTYRCVGFSTNGLLKKSMKGENKWKESQYDLYTEVYYDLIE